jgi:hypothetical protein
VAAISVITKILHGNYALNTEHKYTTIDVSKVTVHIPIFNTASKLSDASITH